jgi:hypothetical protein
VFHLGTDAGLQLLGLVQPPCPKGYCRACLTPSWVPN